jgi:cholinesterase
MNHVNTKSPVWTSNKSDIQRGREFWYYYRQRNPLPKMRFIFGSILAIALSPFVFSQWTSGQEVQTSGGLVTGHKSSKYPDVSEYLGIRYGESTAGKNRFMAPKPYIAKEKIDASQFVSRSILSRSTHANTFRACENMKPLFYQERRSNLTCSACPQTLFMARNQSEDCLFLNIWTRPQSGESKKAVLLWIYGGAFTVGDSSSPSTNGASLASLQDLVVVSINYRVNIFGFPSAPTLPTQNPGLRDIRLAVEWVRDNIARFGGDPERITLFGESAGALATDYYAYAYTKDPIVNGFLPSTGNALISLPLAKTEPGQVWYDLTKKLGCGGREAGEKTVECLQAKTVKEIQAAAGTGSGFNPVVDNVTMFSPEEYKIRSKSGDFIRKVRKFPSKQKANTDKRSQY